MPPPTQSSAWLPEHPPLWSPGWACPPKQSCSTHRNMKKDRLFLIKLSHVLLFVGSSVQYVTGPWFIYTVFKFWGLKWLNAENRLHETSRQAVGCPSSARFIGCLQLPNSCTRKGCSWRQTCQPCLRGAKEGFCMAPVQKQESIFTADTASISRDPSNMGSTVLIAPFAQELFSRWREDTIFVSFHAFPAFPSHHFTFAALFAPGRNFKVGRKIVRPAWKERFPKGSSPVPHHSLIQRALSTSSQSGCSLQTGGHQASSGPRVSTLLLTKKEEKILQLIQPIPLQVFAPKLLQLLELRSRTVWTGTSFRQRQQYSMRSLTTGQKGKLRYSHGLNPPRLT